MSARVFQLCLAQAKYAGAPAHSSPLLCLTAEDFTRQGENAGKNNPGKNNPGKNYPGKNYPGKNYPGKNYPGKNYPGKNYPCLPRISWNYIMHSYMGVQIHFCTINIRHSNQQRVKLLTVLYRSFLAFYQTQGTRPPGYITAVRNFITTICNQLRGGNIVTANAT